MQGVGWKIVISRSIHSPGSGLRLRLYLVDLPERMSVDTLAITVIAPEAHLEEVLADAARILGSIEFHPDD